MYLFFFNFSTMDIIRCLTLRRLEHQSKAGLLRLVMNTSYTYYHFYSYHSG